MKGGRPSYNAFLRSSKKELLMMKRTALIFIALIGLVNNAHGAIISVDPSILLTDYISLGEWNTDGNQEGWNPNQLTNVKVKGGYLWADVDKANDPKLRLLGIPGVDLSSGNYNIVEIAFNRSGVMSRFDFFWGTNNQGFSASRQLTPNASLISNEDVDYVVQFDMSDIASWSGSLSNIRFDPFSDNTTDLTSFGIDYVRVGTAKVAEPGMLAIFGLSLLVFCRRSLIKK